MDSLVVIAAKNNSRAILQAAACPCHAPCLWASKNAQQTERAFRLEPGGRCHLYPRGREDVHMTRRLALLCLASVLGLVAATLPAADTPAGAKVDPKADKYLKAMSSYLAELKRFAFHVEMFFDMVQDDGLKIQFSNSREESVRRPNKIYGKTAGDTANSNFYYDGKTVTVHDRARKTYATEKVPGTIDAMLDDLHDRFGIEQPLADFLFSDPYKILKENVESGIYVGESHVGKTKCHHLAFRQRLLDWQIWIQDGEKPLPRKFVITFKRQIDEPQFIALFHAWDTNLELPDNLFEFQPPADAQKVDFLHRHGSASAAKKPAGR
jgi:hypothetical protein